MFVPRAIHFILAARNTLMPPAALSDSVNGMIRKSSVPIFYGQAQIKNLAWPSLCQPEYLLSIAACCVPKSILVINRTFMDNLLNEI